MEGPVTGLLEIAERAFVRMQAEQLIADCLDRADVEPLNDLVEGLVLEGPSSIGVLREILEEIRTTRGSLVRESLEVRQELEDTLGEFGAEVTSLPLVSGPLESPQNEEADPLEKARRKAPEWDLGEEILIAQVYKDAKDRVSAITRKVVMLSGLEASVKDWFDCLAYEATRERDAARRERKDSHLH